jgi:hypothetical protein
MFAETSVNFTTPQRHIPEVILFIAMTERTAGLVCLNVVLLHCMSPTVRVQSSSFHKYLLSNRLNVTYAIH